jgi:hypothetical protein
MMISVAGVKGKEMTMGYGIREKLRQKRRKQLVWVH